MKKTILLTFILFVLGAQPAFAYIDPGTGSSIISLIVGFFVAIGVLVKTFWYKIKSFFGLSKSTKTDIEKNLK
ncbi:MAG: hypothetical protein H8E55_21105 [Pelagibacterales bacterium]|nr:hypothetical protein [Pelagibacterales bacterium]